MINWFKALNGTLITRAMLKQAFYWGIVIWLVAILTGLIRRLLLILG